MAGPNDQTDKEQFAETPYNFFIPENIPVFLRGQAKDCPEVGDWLVAALKPYIVRRNASSQKIEELPYLPEPDLKARWDECNGQLYQFHIDKDLGNDVRAIATWLKYEHAANAPWLAERNENNIPRRLLSSTYDHLVKKATHWRLHGEGCAPETRIERTWQQHGLTLVRLFNVAALIEEGDRMNNCVSNAHNRMCLARGDSYYSIRGVYGESLATLVIDRGNMLRDFEGPGNGTPFPVVKDCVRVLVREKNLGLNAETGATGFFRQDGMLHDVFALRQNFTARQSLRINHRNDPFYFPEGLTVQGDLSVQDCPRFRAMGPVTVLEDLTVKDCPGLRKIVGPVYVRGNIIISGLFYLEDIKGPIRCDGDLVLEDFSIIRHLKPCISFGGVIKWRGKDYKDLDAVYRALNREADEMTDRLQRGREQPKPSAP